MKTGRRRRVLVAQMLLSLSMKSFFFGVPCRPARSEGGFRAVKWGVPSPFVERNLPPDAGVRLSDTGVVIIFRAVESSRLLELRGMGMRESIVSRRDIVMSGLGLAAVLPRRANAEHVHAPEGALSGQEGASQRTPVEGGKRFEPVPDRLFVTPYDNDPFVVEVESKLKCTCGCLHNVYECRSVDFSCAFWPQHHADIVEQATAGWTAEQIIEDYVMRHGPEYLMAPAARGFNLVAYLLPGTLIAIVGALLLLHLRRSTELAEVAAGVPDSNLSAEDARMLEEELDNLDG